PFSTHRMGRCGWKPILRTHLARLPVGFSIFYKIPKKFIAAYPPANKRRSNLASAQRGEGRYLPQPRGVGEAKPAATGTTGWGEAGCRLVLSTDPLSPNSHRINHLLPLISF